MVLTVCQLAAIPAFAGVYPTGKEEPLFQQQEFQSFKVPKEWIVKELPTGKQFQFVLYWNGFRTVIQTEDGPKQFGESFDFAKDCIVRICETHTPKAAELEDLLKNRNNSILLWVPSRARPRTADPHTWYTSDEDLKEALRVKELFGKRFLALDNTEWCYGLNTGSSSKAIKVCKEVLGLSMPDDRDETATWFGLNWDIYMKKYQDAGLPIWSANSYTLPHLEGRKGVSYIGSETSYNEPWHDPIKMAIVRGAARQYNIPWGQYIADATVKYEGGRPDVRLDNNAHYIRGPYGGGSAGGGTTGIPHCKRILFHCYMGGVNLLVKENDYFSLLSDYDPLTVEQTDPHILALRELKSKYASPYALMWEEFYKNIVKKHDRGVPYTPVALLRDGVDGFDIHGAKTGRAYGRYPFTPGDEQTRDILDALLLPPYEHHTYLSAKRKPRGNYGGEIYDVLTTDASESLLNDYRAIVLMGDARISPEYAANLRRFVENGGTLFTVCEQMTPELWKLAGIRDTGEMGQERGFKAAYLRDNDHYVYTGQGGFTYHKVEMEGAEPLFVANQFENRDWPVATINRVGKGNVIVGTIPWLRYVKGEESVTYADGTKIRKPRGMHPLFSEIMGMLTTELVPVRVYGDEVKVMYNRNKNGWVVTLTNEEGLGNEWPWYSYPEFPPVKPAIREQSTAGVILKPQFEYAEALEWLTDERLSPSADGNIGLLVPPGEVRVVEFRLK